MHSYVILEVDSVSIALALTSTLTLLIVSGIHFLGVIGKGWITLTLWRLRLHS